MIAKFLQQPTQHGWQDDRAESTARNAQAVGQAAQLNEVRGDNVHSGWKREPSTNANQNAITEREKRERGVTNVFDIIYNCV